MKLQTYNGVIRKDEGWWIGWIEEIPGVNSQAELASFTPALLTKAVREEFGSDSAYVLLEKA